MTSWVRGLLASYRVVAPTVEGEGPVRYRPPLAEDGPWSWTGCARSGPPRSTSSPQVEPLLTFRGSGKAVTLEAPRRPDERRR